MLITPKHLNRGGYTHAKHTTVTSRLLFWSRMFSEYICYKKGILIERITRYRLQKRIAPGRNKYYVSAYISHFYKSMALAPLLVTEESQKIRNHSISY